MLQVYVDFQVGGRAGLEEDILKNIGKIYLYIGPFPMCIGSPYEALHEPHFGNETKYEKTTKKIFD